MDHSFHVDNEHVFKEKINEGINFFAGAGFSVLPDKTGNTLPLSKDLALMLEKQFKISHQENYQRTFEILMAKFPQEFQQYLHDLFKVTSCNDLYTNVWKFNIKCFITTNFDNIATLSSEGLKNICLVDLRKGAPKTGEIPYVPLNGSAAVDTDTLYIGTLNVATPHTQTVALFEYFEQELPKRMTLFCGYSLNDPSVQRAVSSSLKNNPDSVWVQCLPSCTEDIDYFRNIGCNVIIGDTKSLLEWARDNLDRSKPAGKNIYYLEKDEYFKRYAVPKSAREVRSVPTDDYYLKGDAQWYHIFEKVPLERSIVPEIHNEASSGKNILIVGGNFTGKTTILMQLALRISGQKYYFDYLSVEQAKRFVELSEDTQVWVFLEHCTNDVTTLDVLSSKKNIRIIATADEIAYEYSKHLVDPSSYLVYHVGELDIDEARQIFNKIPKNIRKNEFSFKTRRRSVSDAIPFGTTPDDLEEEKYNMLEMLGKNVKGAVSRNTVIKILNSIEKENDQSLELIALTTYLTSNYSALSTDVIMAYFNYTTAEQVDKAIQLINTSLNEKNTGITITNDEQDQDYYRLRSTFFSFYAQDVFESESKFKKIYANTVRKCIEEVAPVHIFNYIAFRRSAYDSELFYSLFGDDAHSLYALLNKYDNNAYIFHQWALYCSRLGDFKKAFQYIDKASVLLPHNFSIKNSKAMILFESNKDDWSEIGLNTKKEAMQILQKCYTNDRRKAQHVVAFAKFAIIMSDHGHDEYLQLAYSWLVEEFEEGHKTQLKNTISRKINKKNDVKGLQIK